VFTIGGFVAHIRYARIVGRGDILTAIGVAHFATSVRGFVESDGSKTVLMVVFD